MTIKHKVIKEFQFLSPDKKIFILKAGTILEEYKYKVKNETIDIDKDIVDNNPEFFESIDWKAELLTYMRSEKMPQPAQLGKKLIPFIEDMILSSMQPVTVSVADDSMIKEVERREADIKSRERRIVDKEEEIDIRLKRVEKREDSYKDDLKSLDKKEDDLRTRSKELIEKQLDIDDKLQEVREKERNIDKITLESAKDIDSKYSELQRKIEKDLRALSEREKDIEVSMRELKNRESKLEQREAEIDDRIRDLDLKSEDSISISKEMQGHHCQHSGCFVMLRRKN